MFYLFGFNNAKYDPNLIKSDLLPILVNERDIEPCRQDSEPVHLVQIGWLSYWI